MSPHITKLRANIAWYNRNHRAIIEATHAEWVVIDDETIFAFGDKDAAAYAHAAELIKNGAAPMITKVGEITLIRKEGLLTAMTPRPKAASCAPH